MEIPAPTSVSEVRVKWLCSMRAAFAVVPHHVERNGVGIAAFTAQFCGTYNPRSGSRFDHVNGELTGCLCRHDAPVRLHDEEWSAYAQGGQSFFKCLNILEYKWSYIGANNSCARAFVFFYLRSYVGR